MKSISYKVFYLTFFLCIVSMFFNEVKAQTPIVSFTNTNGGTVQEGTGSSNTTVTIMNPNSNATSVIVVHSGSATYGMDYTSSPDTIVFPANSSSPQFLTLSVLDDCVDEGFETVISTLTNPTNGAQLGISTQTTTISDNDPTPSQDCTYSIPSNAIVVDSTISFFAHNRNFWVCETGELTMQSSNHKVIIENGGIVHAKQNNCEIYVKNGGSIIVEDGERNQIFAEDGAIVTIESGSCNIVYTSGGTVYTDNGTGTFHGTLTCVPLMIDYTAAPANGCVITATHSLNSNTEIEIFPNPTSGEFELRHSDNLVLHHIEVYDNQGLFVMNLFNPNRNLTVSPGIYLMRCVFNKHVIIKRLVVSN